MIRNRGESALEGWLLDSGGFAISLFASWFVAATAVRELLTQVAPSTSGTWELPPILAAGIGFVGLDYLQYWVHRLFHRQLLWRFHLLHHTSIQFRGVSAFRHSLWEALLNPGLWCNAVIVWFLADPSWFLLAVTTGYLLDIWRHAAVQTSAKGPLRRALRSVLVVPEDHRVHHEATSSSENYGINLKLWDKLHGTYRAPNDEPSEIGVANTDSGWRLLLGAARPS